MKRIMLYSLLTLAIAGCVVFVVKAQQKAGAAAEYCPCTPDCQPGDPHCTCPVGCEK